MARKWFYIIQDPFGGPDFKIGITANPRVRLAAYQNAFSSRSRVARFDRVWEGTADHIGKLEVYLKNTFNWSIEFDKAGHSEWVSDMDMATLEAEVEKTIAGMRFHIKPLAAPMPLLLSELDSVLGDQYGSLM
jgi:hypothetical protein